MMQTGIKHTANKVINQKKHQPASIEKKLDFEKDVLPVLVQNCSPCHFPGGKMYERLPFDKEATILTNSDKILKRVDKDEKKAAIKEFILQSDRTGQVASSTSTN
jgi:hypothetical protein